MTTASAVSTPRRIFGLGVEPVLVGFVTDHVFGDDMRLGWSLALVLSIATPLMVLSLRLALRPLREAMTAAETVTRND